MNNIADALRAEQTNLADNYGIPARDYSFVDGSGGGETQATLEAVTKFLGDMRKKLVFTDFHDGLPILAKDGSIGFVTDFQSDPTLGGATGQVHAKTGTYVVGDSSGLLVKGQAYGGYIHAKSGRNLTYVLVVNNVLAGSLGDLIQIIQDEGTISAILWRDN